MARPGINYSDVAKAATQLKEQGLNPTVAEVRKVLSTGSNSTINRHLRDWEEKQGGRIEAEKGIPAPLLTIVRGLYDAIGEDANQKIHATEQRSEQKSEAIETKLAELNTANETLRDNSNKLIKENAAFHEEIQVLQLKQQELQNNLVRQQSENQAQTTRLEDKAEEVERISKQNNHTQDNLEHYRETIRQEREESRQSYEAKIIYLENKNSGNTTRISELNCLLATKNIEIEHLDEKSKEFVEKLNDLSGKKAAQDEYMQKTQLTFDSLKKSYSQLEMNDCEKTNSLNKLTQINLELTIQIATLEEKISNYQKGLAKAEDKINQLQSEKLFLAQKNYELEHQVKLINS